MMMLFSCFEEEMAFFVQWVGGKNKLSCMGRRKVVDGRFSLLLYVGMENKFGQFIK